MCRSDICIICIGTVPSENIQTPPPQFWEGGSLGMSLGGYFFGKEMSSVISSKWKRRKIICRNDICVTYIYMYIYINVSYVFSALF